MIDYATKYCLAISIGVTARGPDALACVQDAVAEAKRPDRAGTICYRGAVFAEAFTGDDPLLRHVRTRVKSPQTNGVVERFFGTLKYEHLYRAEITDRTPRVVYLGTAGSH